VCVCARERTESRQAKSLKAKKARGLLSTEVKRWHSHEVWCLAYSPDGAYLYSGGREAVLVCCQVSQSVSQ
jgi:WD40 repeat protein